MWFFWRIFGEGYETETGYTELEEAIDDLVKDEKRKTEEEEEKYIEKVKKLLNWDYKWNWVVEIPGGGSCKVYV